MDILKRGSEGQAVANWQRFLIARGYDVEADGDFGPLTEKATRSFQASQDLRADGIVGDMTYKAAESLNVPALGSVKVNDAVIKVDAVDARLRRVHPVLAEKAQRILNFAKAAGFNLIVTQGLRTFEEQDALFRKRPKVTNARGGQSMHNYGLAVDFAFVVNGKLSWDEDLYRRIGPWAKLAGLEWGGSWTRFTDKPHVQLKNLPSYKVLLPIFKAGGLAAVWEKYRG